jgi:hypothetical protein
MSPLSSRNCNYSRTLLSGSSFEYALWRYRTGWYIFHSEASGSRTLRELVTLGFAFCRQCGRLVEIVRVQMQQASSHGRAACCRDTVRALRLSNLVESHPGLLEELHLMAGRLRPRPDRRRNFLHPLRLGLFFSESQLLELELSLHA